MSDFNLNQPAFTLTIGELTQIIKEEIYQIKIVGTPKSEKKEPEYLYSLRELAKFLNCSVVTVQKLKNSGRIPFKQFGRKLVFEVSEVLSALDVNKKNRKSEQSTQKL